MWTHNFGKWFDSDISAKLLTTYLPLKKKNTKQTHVENRYRVLIIIIERPLCEGVLTCKKLLAEFFLLL